MSEIAVRTAKQEDLPFIFSTWLRSYRESSFAHAIDSKTFYSEHHKLIEHLISKSSVLIAHPIAQPNVIVGYLVGGGQVLHYVYVKHAFKRMGVAKELIDASSLDRTKPILFTHLTRDAKHLTAKIPALYNPYAL